MGRETASESPHGHGGETTDCIGGVGQGFLEGFKNLDKDGLIHSFCGRGWSWCTSSSLVSRGHGRPWDGPMGAGRRMGRRGRSRLQVGGSPVVRAITIGSGAVKFFPYRLRSGSTRAPQNDFFLGGWECRNWRLSFHPIRVNISGLVKGCHLLIRARGLFCLDARSPLVTLVASYLSIARTRPSS